MTQVAAERFLVPFLFYRPEINFFPPSQIKIRMKSEEEEIRKKTKRIHEDI